MGIIKHIVLAFVYMHFALLDTGVHSSLEEVGIRWVAAVNSFSIEKSSVNDGVKKSQKSKKIL